MSDTQAPIEGFCDDRFARVRDAFVENLTSRGELGAAVCVYLDGEKLVDLWGGHFDLDRTQPWQEDTIVNMASVTKGMAALCVHILVDRGEIDLDEPMATYWPEFAQAGKAAITVRQTLGHNDGVIFSDAAPDGSWLDWAQMTAAIAAQEPAWPPGTQGAYNSHNYGYLIGEPIRRVSGRTPGVFFREEIAEPLGVDYHIGLAEADLARVTDLNPNPKSTTLNAFKDPSTNLARAWHQIPKDGPAEGKPSPFNRRDYRVKEFPSGNGHGNARAVARIYAALACGGEIDGVRLWSEAAVARMAELQWDSECGMTHRPFRMGLGLFLNSPPLQGMGPNRNAFGHMGAGGAFAFADPQRRLAFAYSPNFMCEGAGVGERCDALVAATFASV